MAKPVVNYLGHDLFDLGYVANIPEITETKGFGRGKLSPSDFTLNCKNIDDQFSLDNPSSFLSGSSWQFSSIKLYDEDSSLIFDGIVSNITRNHVNKTAQLLCKDVIFQNRKTSIAYTSSDWETPATAAYNIMVQEGFTNYDNASIQNSISVLTKNACYVKVNIAKQDNLTLFTALEKLGQYAAADVYMYRNKVYFKHWIPYTGGVSVYFDYNRKDLRPRSAPQVRTLEESFFNDYSIGYNGDLEVPATDDNSNDIGQGSRNRFGTQSVPEMRCNSSAVNQISFKDKASATYIGETYINRGHSSLSPIPKILQVISFDVDYSYRSYIDLGTYFKMTFSEEGWTDKVFEVSSIKRSLDKRNIGIEAWEVKV